MHRTKLWHASSGRKFPLNPRQQGLFQLEVAEIDLKQLAALEPEKGMDHVFLIQMEKDDFAGLKEDLQSARLLTDYPKLFLVPEAEYKDALKEYSLIPRAYLIDDSVRPRNMMLLLEFVLQQEYYRQVVYRLSGELRQQSDLFENMFELARAELQASREENEAFRHLSDYAESRRRFQNQVTEAMETVVELKDQELLTLKEQLEATEHLSEYRSKELKHAQQTIQAAEAALDLSRKENLRRDQIIDAMERVRTLSESELLELIQENNDLRQKMGMPEKKW